MDIQLRELIPFLRDKNSKVRQVALSNLLPQTPKGAPHRKIFFEEIQTGGLQKQKENNFIRDLKLLCRDQIAVAHDAFRALVNLSDSPMLVGPLTEASFLDFIISYIVSPQAVLSDLAAMLLSNLTSSSVACAAIASMKIQVIPEPCLAGQCFPIQSRCGSCPAPVPYPSNEPYEVQALPLLIESFVQGAQIEEDPSKRMRKGKLHFLAGVFANLSASTLGRDFFYTPRPANLIQPDASHLEYPLAKIVPFTEHEDTIRRGGVTSTIKNCAFHARGHKALLSPESIHIAVPPSNILAPGIDVLPYLLLPLAGPEEFDLEDQEKLPEPLQFLPPTKKREPDAVVRLMHVETLLLLCHTRWGRDYLRDHGVYEIVRAAHENETNEKVQEHIERLVQLIQGDEPAVDPTEEEGFDSASDDIGKKRMENSTMDEDEDSRIEEI
ncbi:hypothetical protein APHAL10511_005742 [Amanita phalloides]|nr:hypothetical protein APHAL10511_005742 [Amanita phalloides]